MDIVGYAAVNITTGEAMELQFVRNADEITAYWKRNGHDAFVAPIAELETT